MKSRKFQKGKSLRDEYCLELNLEQNLYQYVSTKEQAEILLQIIDDIKVNEGYKKYIIDEEKKLHNSDKEEESAIQKLNDLIVYCEKYEYCNEAKILKEILLPQPKIQKRMTPFMMNKQLKEELKKTLQNHGFKNITKLITSINNSIKY
ncbi:MAG: hypothetical protein WC272_09620 [Sulfurimonas sp.]|jgi:hypothetical protein